MGIAATMLANTVGSVAGELTKELSYGIGNLTGYNERVRKDQLKQQQALTDIQVNANKDLADYSNDIQRKMYDYTYNKNTPEELMKQYKEAGLNPAMMYQGGGGVSGMTVGNTSAGSASGGSASDETSRKMADLQQEGMALQMAKLQSEIKVNESVANANNASADLKSKEGQGIDQNILESQTRIENIKQDTSNKRIQERLTGLQSDYQEIVNSYQGELTEANINKINTDIQYLNEDTKRILLSNEITEKSKNALIQNNILQNSQMLVNILKGKADISQIEASIRVLKTSADLNIIKTEGEKINNAINMIEKNIPLRPMANMM